MVLSYISICTSLLLFWFDYIKHLFVLYLFYVKFRRVITPITMTLYVCSRVTRREYQIPSLVLKNTYYRKNFKKHFFLIKKGEARPPPPPPPPPLLLCRFYSLLDKTKLIPVVCYSVPISCSLKSTLHVC